MLVFFIASTFYIPLLQAQFANLSIENLSTSDDTVVLQKGLKVRQGTVDVHHAGTAMRFLIAFFSALDGAEVLLTGSERMQQRPVGILVEALRSLGAKIDYAAQEGFPPLQIIGQNIQNNKVNINAGVSSQYISALMLIAPMLPNGLQINLEGKITSTPYIEMTLSLLEKIGVKGTFTNQTIQISAVDKIDNTTITVESDWSSASYFYSLVALSENAEITISSFSKQSLQGDAALISIYEKLGVKTVFNSADNTITLSKTNLPLPDSIELNLANTPDLAQTIAVSCFGLGIACNLTGLHTLKIKETDRLIALQCELQKLGAVVIVDMDSLKLHQSKTINPEITIATYQDHRMAMAFAPLALRVPIVIDQPLVVSKSYPTFWDDLKKVGLAVTLK